MFTRRTSLSLLVLLVCSPATPAQKGGTISKQEPLDWKSREAWALRDHVQLTSGKMFAKAGEAYFDHNTPPKWVIFQAVEVPPEGQKPSPFYSMYVAELNYDAAGGITGIAKPIRVSPPGSANSCGWFSPTQPGRVLFGSTISPPKVDEKSGFQVGSRRYLWQFPDEMDVVTTIVPAIDKPEHSVAPAPSTPTPLFHRDRYDAECSYSPNGRYVLYSHVREAKDKVTHDADIWIYDTKSKTQVPLIVKDGYDGGPFFSPDGTWICYRSDRRGDNELQLFTAELAFDADGVPTGIKREVQVTDNKHVNWAPYWYPTGRAGKGVLVYATSEIGHYNYEVFAIETDPDKPASDLRKTRITAADGFDGLPAFSDDGKWMMWTSQRGPKTAGEDKPSSQIWIARTVDGVFSNPDVLFGTHPGSGRD